MTAHPDETRLNDYADELLAAGAERAVEAHLARCEACRRRVELLRDLMGELRALPRGIAPPRDLRPPVAPRVPEVPGRPTAHAAGRLRPWLRAAAAIAALLGAAALAWIAVEGPAGRDAVVTERAGAGRVAAAVAEVVPIEPYADATRDLLATFEARRAELSPEAARLLRQNLAVVDASIRELERARAEAPNASGLSRLLEERYRTKLELLRDAARLLSEA